MFLALLAAADFALLAGAGTRGERRVEATAHAVSEDFGLTLGASTSEGPQAPQRQQILFGAERGVIKGELRIMPKSAGLLEVAAESGVHFESISLVLGARTGSLGRMQLRGAGARLELEGQLTDEVRAGLGASAWALQLDGGARGDPWTAWGAATLDWAQRWEAGAWISRDFFDSLSVAPSLSVSQPAEAGFEIRSGVAFELPAGPIKLRAGASVAKMWPQEMWMTDLTLGVSMTLE
ncbi:MAG: hypothetical protein ABR567_03575 [Myxococcales bacterium]|nr:hypothetical protein [Myxococcales bacterium]